MFYVLQDDNYDCGFACLKSLLASLNHDHNYLYLPNPKVEKEAYSFYELMEYAEKLGFTLSSYFVKDKENLSLAKNEPIMVSAFKEGKVHMLLLYKVNKKYVYYLDPAVGKKKMKKDIFISLWDGKVLKIDDFKKKKCPFKKKNLLTNFEEFMMDFLEIIACLSLTAGLFFINEKYPFYLSIILFACFGILEILLRSYCLRVYKKIDDRIYNSSSLKVKEGKMKEFYTTLENNKRYEVGINLDSIYAVMSIIVVSIFIYITGGYSLYYLLFGLLFAFIEVVFINPYLKRKNIEIMELESRIGEDDLGLIRLAHVKAYKYGRITLLYRYTCFGMTLLGIVLIMALSGVISIPYIIFYLCINLFFYKNMVSLLSIDEKIKKHRQSIVHQINLVDM
ncbi:MAG: hypothetical protein E7178_02605 [Erysipelotrichaceae bacterium]|nr:hypothetical protein [Erysipelotrichaceae bacterium]